VIRFDFDERYVFEPAERALPWFARVLIADFAFYLIFAFFIGPWLALLWLLWPHPKPQQIVEDHTPIVFLQPQEIPRSLLRPPPPAVKTPPAEKPPERIVLPGNTKPFEAGDPPAPQPTKAPEAPQPQPQQPPQPQPQPEPPRPEPESQIARNSATPPSISPNGRDDSPRPPVGGVLGQALRNLDRYAAQSQSTANPLGGATDPGAAIQFDRKGVDFDAWLRRFVRHVRSFCFVPLAAMNLLGRVVLQFTIHKDGRISELRVAQPSDIDAFTRAAHNAIMQSNPTVPLPREYPDEAMPIVVTFYYNERVPN
jgi:TonB family protein